MYKRVFLIVLDSLGAGEAPDAAAYGDEGSSTLDALIGSGFLSCPHLQRAGLFSLPTLRSPLPGGTQGSRAVLREKSAGKDTTTGHWELAGLVSARAFPTFPDGFPPALLEAFSAAVGRGVLCNRPYSGTEVIRDYGEEHMRTGKYIVYTSADSVFQVAAHEAVVPVETLYRDCRTARDLLTGENAVGRVIARPFAGEPGSFYRTAGRHDFSLEPSGRTLLDAVTEAGMTVTGIGKISDIFAGRSVTASYPTRDNDDGVGRLLSCMEADFTGLCFVNPVDFDMLYGHRNDVRGYAEALNRFDVQLPSLFSRLREDDLLLITADHGCDPSTPSTDHSREYVPLLLLGNGIRDGVPLGVFKGFDCVAATVCAALGIPPVGAGKDLLPLCTKN